LTPPENEEIYGWASGVCSSQWENESIVGPYYAAIHEELTDEERLELFMRAARHDRFDPAYALEQLLYAVPTGDPARDARLVEIFTGAADGPPGDTGMLDDELEAHVFAVRGLARLGAPMPPCTADASAKERAWSHVDQLVASLEDTGVDAAEVWDRLLAEVPSEAIDAVFKLRWAGRGGWTDRQVDAAVLGRLLHRDPEQFKRLFLWGLEHRAAPRTDPMEGDSPTGFIIRQLGVVGDAATVEILRPYLAEPTLADDVVKAIRDLNGDV
jgi:hypothetical protein